MQFKPASFSVSRPAYSVSRPACSVSRSSSHRASERVFQLLSKITKKSPGGESEKQSCQIQSGQMVSRSGFTDDMRLDTGRSATWVPSSEPAHEVRERD